MKNKTHYEKVLNRPDTGNSGSPHPENKAEVINTNPSLPMCNTCEISNKSLQNNKEPGLNNSAGEAD